MIRVYNIRLLPYKYKYYSGVILLSGIILTYLTLYSGTKPQLFDTKVFAIYSSYLESRFFAVIDNNISEELSLLLIYSGMLLWTFSSEKNEQEDYNNLRFKSLLEAILMNVTFIFLSIIFFFGFAFIDMLIINIFFTPSAYNIIFRVRLYAVKRDRSKKKLAEFQG